MASYSSITNYLAKSAHPLASAFVFTVANDIFETKSIQLDEELLKDFVIQAVASYSGEMVSPYIRGIVPILGESLTQSVTTAGLNVLISFGTEKMMKKNASFDGAGAVQRFIISLGSEVVVSTVLDNALSLVGTIADTPNYTPIMSGSVRASVASVGY